MQTVTATSPFTGNTYQRTSKGRIYTHAVVSYLQAETVREQARKSAEYHAHLASIYRAAAAFLRTGAVDPVLNEKVRGGSYNEMKAGVRTEIDKLRYDQREGSTWSPSPEQYDVWATGSEQSAAHDRKIGVLPIVNNEGVTFHQSYKNAEKTLRTHAGFRVAQIVETVIKGGK